MNNFSEKKALVLGGSGGIGFEISKMLLKNGAEVTVHGKSKENLKKAQNKLFEETKVLCKTVEFNFTAENFCDLESSEIKKIATDSDILCVCFGPFLQTPLEKMVLSDWQNMALLDYALPGTFVSFALQNMIEKNWGRILLFGGTGTNFRNVFKTNIAYSAAKSAVGVLTQSVAANYAKNGITCNAILPGFVETEYLSEELKKSLKEKSPQKKLIGVSTIAEHAEFLLKNEDLNGVLLKVDSGWSPEI